MIRRLSLSVLMVCALAAPGFAATKRVVEAVAPDGPVGIILPTFTTSAYPYFSTLKQYTFEAGGNPDTQGWTTHDLTAQNGSYWRVDDFAGMPGYAPLAGTKSMWCGIRAGVSTDPLIKNAPGYGDFWTQILQSAVWASAAGQAITFGCIMKTDLSGLDHVDVEYKSASGVWTLLGTVTGVQNYNPSWVVPAGAVGSTIQFRFVFSSDDFDSDENYLDTHGAVIIDNVYAYHTPQLYVIGTDTFEADEIGNGSMWWSALVPDGFGNYAGLVSGSGVVQNGTPNTSHVWSFFNGSTQTYACGGQPGQFAVPKTAVPGSTRLTDYLCNEVWSPFIDLTLDKNGDPVDPAMNTMAVEFDCYSDLPYTTNRVLVGYRWRFMVGGVPQEWIHGGVLLASSIAQWLHVNSIKYFSQDIPPGATHVQLALQAIDYAYLDGATGMCHSQSPLFDNVKIHRLYEPITIYSAADSGPGTLRQAILDANANPDMNSILFRISGAGPHTIALSSPLPTITDRVWIDGFSQDGSSPNTYPYYFPSTAQIMIALNGTSAGGGAVGLSFGPTSYSVARGLAIGGFSGAGIRSQSTSLLLYGSYIGTDASGYVAVPNGIGIHEMNLQTDIGGPSNEDRMLISGNSGDGIRVDGGSGPIFNCRIGLDSQLNPMGNGGHGIHVTGGSLCQIGQPTLSECNGEYTDRMWIGYNGGDGIRVESAASQVNVYQPRIEGNGGLAIDLGGNGPTANDPLDADTGANGLMNHPVITTASGTTITGDMNGAPNLLHHVEFFAGSGCQTSKYLGYQDVTTDGSGHAALSFTCDPIPPASEIAATSMANYNTSELSPCVLSTNTLPGNPGPLVLLYDGSNQLKASVQFGSVASAGNTYLAPTSPPAPNPSVWEVGPSPAYWDISTTATLNPPGTTHVFLHYNPLDIPGPENMLRVLHYAGGSWVDITDTIDLAGNRVGGTTTSLSPFVLAVHTGATGVGDSPAPKAFALRGNIPNPFNPVTTIAYDVPAGGADVTIAIFDVSGRLVRTLVTGHRDAGSYTAQWNGEDDRGALASSGVYFYRMRAGAFVETRKMVLLK